MSQCQDHQRQVTPHTKARHHEDQQDQREDSAPDAVESWASSADLPEQCL